MAGTLPLVAPDRLTRLRGGDERALHDIFVDAYDPLVADLAGEIGDAGAAARVVERTFVNAWSAREGFDSPEAFRGFLRDALADAGAHERKRLESVHRFEQRERVSRNTGNHSAPPTEVAWQAVERALHPAAADGHDSTRDAAAAARHHAAQHVAHMADQRIPWIGIALGAAFILVAGAAFWYFNKASGSARLIAALESPEVRLLETNPGQRGTLTLEDGSTVDLGADSHLSVPPGFATRVRGVGLDGTARFTVDPSSGGNFTVRAGRVLAVATGTVFDVRSARGEANVTIHVVEGTVRVSLEDSTRVLAAGQSVTIDSLDVFSEPTADALAAAIGWTNGRLTLRDWTLGAAIPEIKRWYAMDLRVDDSRLLERRVSIDVPLESSREAIAALEASGDLAFGYGRDGKQMIMRDAARLRR